MTAWLRSYGLSRQMADAVMTLRRSRCSRAWNSLEGSTVAWNEIELGREVISTHQLWDVSGHHPHPHHLPHHHHHHHHWRRWQQRAPSQPAARSSGRSRRGRGEERRVDVRPTVPARCGQEVQRGWVQRLLGVVAGSHASLTISQAAVTAAAADACSPRPVESAPPVDLERADVLTAGCR
ncbi:hypothetical protein PLESTB_001735000 [Pleodorina starrii]|uniref:Uncharacterized protein n=1 Tax=Pleodorina starrii TaxID=330485 RepID=A0A9W6BZ50_9CHLO|nr:hypothetical protein PLESTB_001735000 [Pleodorina starrii]